MHWTVPAPVESGSGSRDPSPHLYQIDIVRAVTFACVVAVHGVLFTEGADSVIGYGLIHILHFTREVFFALTAFVLCYSGRNRTERPRQFWKRRFALIVPAYILWNLVYAIAGHITKPIGPSTGVEPTIANLATGYYHLYFLLVTMQVYLLFPLLLWLLRKTARHHLAVLIASGLLQLGLMTCTYYHWPAGEPARTLRHMCTSNSFVLAYQFYVIAGALGGTHYEKFHAWITARTRQMTVAICVVLAITIGVYAHAVHNGIRPNIAADIFQPVIVPWACAVTIGLYLLGNAWVRTKRFYKPVLWSSQASFGIYLIHPLVLIYLIPLLGLGTNHQDLPQPWDAILATLLAITIAGGVTEILRRSPGARITLGRQRKPAERMSGVRVNSTTPGQEAIPVTSESHR